MILDQHGASLYKKVCRSAPSMRAIVPSGLDRNVSWYIFLATTRRPLYTSRSIPGFNMKGYIPPSKWKLWHPSNGILFAAGQQPLRPPSDSARLFHSLVTEQSTSTSTSVNITGGVNTTLIRETHVRTETLDASAGQEDAQPGENKAVADDTPVAKEPVKEDLTPPVNNLDFDIPIDAFRAARGAARGSPESYFSYTMYRGPGTDGEKDAKVKVHYCRSRHTAERVCQYFKDEKVLGFDLEWVVADRRKVTGFRKNVSLIQLASPSRIALFHVALFPEDVDPMPKIFSEMMHDQQITKVGVSIKGDCTRLRTHLGIDSRGLFELSHLYKLVTYYNSPTPELIDRRLVSLARQVDACIHLPMLKEMNVRASDWSKPLRMDQIVYSASDAYAAVQLYAVLDHQRKLLRPTPPLPYHAELNMPIRLKGDRSIPTSDDEDGGDVEAEGEQAQDTVSAAMSRFDLVSANETIEIEVDGEEATAEPRSKKAPGTTEKKPKDARVEAAETWLKEYRAAKPKTRATPASLRAYRIWKENPDLDPPAIAELLREPPLQTSTVVTYILEAIKAEKLPYSRARLAAEVLPLLPDGLATSRYKALVQDTQES